MTTVQEIEAAVARLPGSELDRFREWFIKFDTAEWDRKFEEDARSGKLDYLADQALDDLAQGRCSEL